MKVGDGFKQQSDIPMQVSFFCMLINNNSDEDIIKSVVNAVLGEQLW